MRTRSLVLGVLVLASGGRVSAQSVIVQPPSPPPLRVVDTDGGLTAEFKALDGLLQQFTQAWNVGDADRLSALFDPEQGRVRSWTESFEGHDRVRAWFADALGGRFLRSRLELTRETMRIGLLTGSVGVSFRLESAISAAAAGRFEISLRRDDFHGPWYIARLWSFSFNPGEAPARVGGAVHEPKRLVNVDPVFPDVAKQAGVQGVVVLDCVIGSTGEIVDVEVLRSVRLLDEAAVAAVRQWRYEPTLQNGVAIPVVMTITVNFRLS